MAPAGDFLVPTVDEVRAAIDDLPVKPIDWEIEKCAEAFIAKMDNEGWRVRDWRARLRTYAANWYNNRASAYSRQLTQKKPLHETVDSPAREQRDEDIPW